MVKNPGEKEQEHTQKELIDTKIDTLLGLSSRTEVAEEQEESGSRVIEQNFGLKPPLNDSVLRRLGYGSVAMTRRSRVSLDGELVYPQITTVIAYDERSDDDLLYVVHQATKGNVVVAIGDQNGPAIPLGSDKETGEITTDIEQFDQDSPSQMMPTRFRRLEGNEYLTLLSIITACEADDR